MAYETPNKKTKRPLENDLVDNDLRLSKPIDYWQRFVVMETNDLTPIKFNPFAVSKVSAICANVAMKDFKRFTTCDDVTNKTSVTVLTKTECAMACAGQDWCISFSVTTTPPRLCYLHSEYLKPGVCEGQYKHYYDIEPCFYGGEYNVTSGKCVCHDGYVGDHCERLMQDCGEGTLYSYYANQNGIFLCQPKGAPAPIKVRCFMQYKGRAVLMTQTSGNQNYTRTWEEYKRGFGSLSGDHWLGNDNIHYITSGRSHYLLVQLWTPGNSRSNQLAQRFYYDFRVGPEVDDYKVTFASSFPNAQLAQRPAECLVNATPFSTLDVDHSSGAVELTKSGFWHANPPKCNPTGHLKPTDTSWGGDKTDVFWEDGIDGEAVNRINLFIITTNPNDLA
ncbi:angiopoietin-related protein 2-like [Haliotis asinina]|uniref:angiopoietin-related protein 2-like n=1 Tax=Haliotis asinina TaxID=109174 RepID=UPI00353189B9